MSERTGTLKTTLTAGALIRRQVCSQLERVKFHGQDIKWVESKGIFESDFHIIYRGLESQLRSFEITLKEWCG